MSCDHRNIEYPISDLQWCRDCGAIRGRGYDWVLPRAEVQREQIHRTASARSMHAGMAPAEPERKLNAMERYMELYGTARPAMREVREQIATSEMRRVIGESRKMPPPDVPDPREATEAVRAADKVFK